MSRYRRSSKKKRLQTFKRQEGLCYYCGNQTLFENWTIDHKDPVSRRGSKFVANIVGSCYNCNKCKGNMTELEFLQTDYLTPHRRAALGMMMVPLVSYRVAKHRHEERLTKMLKIPFTVRFSRWYKRLWQRIEKLNW